MLKRLKVEASDGKVWLYAADADATIHGSADAVALSDDAVHALRVALNNAQRSAAAQRQITGYVRDIDPDWVAPQATES